MDFRPHGADALPFSRRLILRSSTLEAELQRGLPADVTVARVAPPRVCVYASRTPLKG